MGTLESQIKLIKAIVAHPEEPVTKIADYAGVAQGTAYTNLEEIYNVYMNKTLNEEDNIPNAMASLFEGKVTPEEMLVTIEYLQNRTKKFNNKSETINSNSSSMDLSDGSMPEIDIGSNTKALQIVLTKFSKKGVADQRIKNAVEYFAIKEPMYKQNPYAVRELLKATLGEGMADIAFKEFMDLVKFYVPKPDAMQFGASSGGGGSVGVQNGGIDPVTMSMMLGDAGGEMNPMAMMAGMNVGGGNWLQQILIADMMEERRRKRQQDAEDARQKIEDRRLQAKREFEEAENRRMMTMMMMNMAGKNDSSIPPGYTVRRTYDASGKPIDEYIPISQTAMGQNGVNGGNSADVVRTIAEVLPKLMPPQNNQGADFMQAMALKALDKLNVQTDPLEQAARVMEVVERFKPQQASPEDPYKKIEAEIAMLDKKMAWWDKEKQWEAQQLDKKIAQENTKGYIETIERVLSNVGAPLVEKFATGFAQRAAAGQPMTMPGQPPQAPPQQMGGIPPGMTEEEYFLSLPPEQLEAIRQQRDIKLAEFQSRNVALEKAYAAKVRPGADVQEGGGTAGGGYYVNTGEGGGA